MQKYQTIRKLTKDYLEGKLEKLTISYDENKCVELLIEYTDAYSHKYDYDLLVDIKQQKIDFLSHKGFKILSKVPLNRNNELEENILKLFT